MAKIIACPCYSTLGYEQCCKKYHTGHAAESALALMRSRYAAYSMGLVDYIMDTTHPQNPTRNPDRNRWRKELLAFSRSAQFTGLSIISFEDGMNEAFVSFKAGLSQAGHDMSFAEKSRFLKENGRWTYESGKAILVF